jgi:hypothetical protein
MAEYTREDGECKRASWRAWVRSSPISSAGHNGPEVENAILSLGGGPTSDYHNGRCNPCWDACGLAEMGVGNGSESAGECQWVAADGRPAFHWSGSSSARRVWGWLLIRAKRSLR